MKIQQWREWWSKARGSASVGTHDTREALVFDGWSAGWDAAEAQSQLEIMHLKAQLLRIGNHEGAYKAAYLAGQMSKQVKTFSGGKPNYVIPPETPEVTPYVTPDDRGSTGEVGNSRAGRIRRKAY
jgi:hypothetical protein